jgi:ACS family hexuronate transporter-like MFS transporter
MFQIRHLRWYIATLLAAASALSYLDRQNLPVAIIDIQKTIPITDKQYSHLSMGFLLAYGVMYAIGGRILDLLGTRRGYALMIAWWSVATLGLGLVKSVWGLGLGLFMVGLGEGGGFPGSAKAVSEWFPPRERSFAFGIFNTGSSVGAVMAPPLIALIIVVANWRCVFYFAGILGAVWVAFWWRLYTQPEKHRLITVAEREYLQTTLAGVPSSSGVDAVKPWGELFRHRQTWGLVLAKLVSDSAWFFYIFWLPKYLSDVCHLDIKHVGYYAWVPYAFAGLGSFSGGWLSSYLIRQNLSVDRSRKLALGLSAAMMPVSLLIMTSPLRLMILFFGVAFLGHQFWSTILQTLAADIFPSATVGSVAGIMGAAGSLGALGFNFLVGQVLTYYHNYSRILTTVGFLHPAAFLLILLIVGKIEPLEANLFWRQRKHDARSQERTLQR